MMQQLLMRRPHLRDLPPLPAAPQGYALHDLIRGPDPGEDADLARIACLLAVAFTDAAWTPAKAREAFILDASVRRTVMITHGDVAVATASARLLPDAFPGSGYVHWVATDPAHAGKRLGWLVSLAVLHAFADLGCVDVVLETDDYRIPALKTYLGLGFEPVIRDESHPRRWEDVRAKLAQPRG